jgi:putative colanic acid biosynthesis acetyltransferase WcaF
VPRSNQPLYQDLSSFRLPANFRGKSPFVVQLWWVIQALLFHTSPQFLYGWRRFLLRLFGAEIGEGVLVRPSVRVTYPWRLSIGDHSWIGDHVELYTLGPIRIGSNAVVSQGSYLCTATHDYSRSSFDMQTRSVTIEDEAWVAAHCFVAPGVTVKRGAMVASRSLVLKDVPAGMIAAGHPAQVLRPRPRLAEADAA